MAKGLGRNSLLMGVLLAAAVSGAAGAASGAMLPEQAGSRMARSGIVGPGVVTALQTSDRARVMVSFEVPGAPDPQGRTATFTSAPARAALVAQRQAILDRLSPGDFLLKQSFQSINAIAGEVTAAGVLRLLEDAAVLRIDPDEGGSAHLAQAIPLMKLDVLQGLGYKGAGVTVAVLDTGIDTDHADLKDDLVAQQCYCTLSGGGGCCPGGGTSKSGAGAAEDDNGHGTNVCGIITSKGTVSSVGGAPDADIVAIKVLDSTGGFYDSSDVVAGLDWIINNRPEVDVVNMSLGTFSLFSGDCDNATAYTQAFATAINTLRTNGVLVFASSGNSGSGTSMSAPACVKNTISVGAVYDADVGYVSVLGCTDATTAADKVTCFSNSDSATDIFAPGAPTTSTGMGGGTSTYYGTSQASPAAASCAAALLSKDSSFTPDDIEGALKASSTRVTDVTNGLSFPRVDCRDSYEALGSCPASPLSGCNAAPKSFVKLKDNLNANKRSFVWKWLAGTEIVASFGDPTRFTGYALCLYDDDKLKMAARIVSAGLCNRVPCWKDLKGKGFRYRNPAVNQHGILSARLKEGAGKAKIIAKGKGANLALPLPIAQTTSVKIQLVRNTTAGTTCWESVFTPPSLASSSTEFRDKEP